MTLPIGFLKQHGYSLAAKQKGDLWTGRVRRSGLQIAITQPYFTRHDALEAARHLVAKIVSRNQANQ